MTMDEAKQMIQRAFVLGGIQEWYDGKSRKWCLSVADKNSDGGYRILAVGNYTEVKELEQLYNSENEVFDRYAKAHKSIKRTSDNDLWESPNREMLGRNSGVTHTKQEGVKGNTSTENDEYVLSDNRKTSDGIKLSDRDNLEQRLQENLLLAIKSLAKKQLRVEIKLL